MKNTIKYAVAALSVMAVTACTDLDTEPLGGTVTSKQKESTLTFNPSMIEAGVNSLPDATKLIMSVTSDSHSDFGVASLFIVTDSRGMDMPSPYVGYNWYRFATDMADFQGSSTDNNLVWCTFYNLIRTANAVEKATGHNPEQPDKASYLGQALAYRAYSYLNLVQLYAPTYLVDPEAPAVPIITAENLEQTTKFGCARSSVAKVYEQIIDDIDRAIENLALAEQSGVVRRDKTFISLGVAYGIKARAALLMGEWEMAYNSAVDAINYSVNNEGLNVMDMQDAALPGFNDMNALNIMWAIHTQSTESFTQGVVNFPSMMGSWMPSGYCSAGVYRCINRRLYNSIPMTDIRRNWWLDGTNVPATLPAPYASYITSCENSNAEFLPYTQLKFGAANNNPGTTNGAVDIPLMRVEEMYLIACESLAHVQPAQGAQLLQSFVGSCRDAAYTCTATSTEAIVDEIWKQRRIELWGEGFSYMDMLRLQKPLDRRGGGFDLRVVYVVQPGDPVLLFNIIQREQQANPLIGPCASSASQPSPVADEE